MERRPRADQNDPQITEVILSGGDPLTLVNSRLAALIQLIQDVAHVRRLRIHTRLPIVIPQRVDSGLLAVLSDHRLATVCVIHANHPNEIDRDVARAIRQMHGAGMTMLNQSVLLRGSQ